MNALFINALWVNTPLVNSVVRHHHRMPTAGTDHPVGSASVDSCSNRHADVTTTGRKTVLMLICLRVTGAVAQCIGATHQTIIGVLTK